jgi:hypothetical protein
MSVPKPDLEVALSYAAEQRSYVQRVAERLADLGMMYFYDRDHDGELWGRDLIEDLQQIFEHRARYCVMFVSSEYASKVWPTHEKCAALTRALREKAEYVLPVRFDQTVLPGLSGSIAYLSAQDMTPEQLADTIFRKVRGGKSDDAPSPPSFRKPKLSKPSLNPYEESERFVQTVAAEIKRRGDELSSDDVAVTIMKRDGGRTAVRVLLDGMTRYSLDMWVGGSFGDKTICFYGIEGEPHSGSSGCNATGEIAWDKNLERPVFVLSDLSLLRHSGDTHHYRYEDFIERLWHQICDVLESDQ